LTKPIAANHGQSFEKTSILIFLKKHKIIKGRDPNKTLINAIVIGRMSENNSLYREDLATYSKDDVFNHSLAEGFIYMWGMSNKIWAELNSKTKD